MRSVPDAAVGLIRATGARGAAVARISEAHPGAHRLIPTSRHGIPRSSFDPPPGMIVCMVNYRRSRVPGGTFFFTVTLRDRHSDLLVRHVDVLKDAWRRAQARFPHEVVAAVVLPDHLHAVLVMPEGRCDYPALWREIKKGFTRRVAPRGPSPWQPRFWEHTIRDERDFAAHIDYVHINPLKHGLVDRVDAWPHSTFHRYVREGKLAPDWAHASAGTSTSHGER